MWECKGSLRSTARRCGSCGPILGAAAAAAGLPRREGVSCCPPLARAGVGRRPVTAARPVTNGGGFCSRYSREDRRVDRRGSRWQCTENVRREHCRCTAAPHPGRCGYKCGPAQCNLIYIHTQNIMVAIKNIFSALAKPATKTHTKTHTKQRAIDHQDEPLPSSMQAIAIPDDSEGPAPAIWPRCPCRCPR